MGALAAWARTTSMPSTGAYDAGLRLLDSVRAMNAPSARDHLSEACSIAEHLGNVDSDGGWHQLSFGPSNTAVHEVAVSVELGDCAAVSRSRALRCPPTCPHPPRPALRRPRPCSAMGR